MILEEIELVNAHVHIEKENKLFNDVTWWLKSMDSFVVSWLHKQQNTENAIKKSTEKRKTEKKNFIFLFCTIYSALLWFLNFDT